MAKKERFFSYEPYQEKYYCQKCDINHKFKSGIGMNHIKYGVHPFGVPNTVVKYEGE